MSAAPLRRVGVISDTHDLVRPEALRALRGSDLVLHAGDVCGPEVLEALRAIAPVVAVRGNNDHGRWADALPETATVRLGDVTIVMIHDVHALSAAAARGAGIVVSGHSHRPGKDVRDGVLFFNPGSAGPRRFQLPISVGRFDVQAGGIEATLLDLGRAAARRDGP
jgi:putative phosphoesterase